MVKWATIIVVASFTLFGIFIGAIIQYNLDIRDHALGQFPISNLGHPMHHAVPDKQ